MIAKELDSGKIPTKKQDTGEMSLTLQEVRGCYNHGTLRDTHV